MVDAHRSLVRAEELPLEQRDDAMDAGEQIRRRLLPAFQDRDPMTVAAPLHPVRAGPPVCRHDAPRLGYFAYNFIRIHRTLRVSPAMAAGVTDRLWDVSALVVLLESGEGKKAALLARVESPS